MLLSFKEADLIYKFFSNEERKTCEYYAHSMKLELKDFHNSPNIFCGLSTEVKAKLIKTLRER